jgi:hypothetical protein
MNGEIVPIHANKRCFSACKDLINNALVVIHSIGVMNHRYLLNEHPNNSPNEMIPRVIAPSLLNFGKPYRAAAIPAQNGRNHPMQLALKYSIKTGYSVEFSSESGTITRNCMAIAFHSVDLLHFLNTNQYTKYNCIANPIYQNMNGKISNSARILPKKVK